MRSVFADTCYWVAVANPRDSLHKKALEVSATLTSALIVTSDEVLVEFLTMLRRPAPLRALAAKLAHSILDNPNVRVLPQTRASFLAGLSLYERRPDKKYSLTDCISMEAMRQHGITEVLTNDEHFGQENFKLLLKE